MAQGTVLQVRTTDADRQPPGQPEAALDFTVIRDVTVNGWLAIPRGATVHGVVTETKNAGQLDGSPELALRLTSLDLGGRNYPLDSDEFRVKGPSKTGHTAGNIAAARFWEPSSAERPAAVAERPSERWRAAPLEPRLQRRRMDPSPGSRPRRW